MKLEWIAAEPLALGLCWNDKGLASITLAYSKGHRTSPAPSPTAKSLEAALRRYVAGQDPDWPDLDLDFDALPPFTSRALRTLQERVGYGQTVSYGQLAAMAGSPKAARAAGQALRRNPWPLVVPCHRVLGADGSLTGFSNPAGLALKRDLLALEGILDSHAPV